MGPPATDRTGFLARIPESIKGDRAAPPHNARGILYPPICRRTIRKPRRRVYECLPSLAWRLIFVAGKAFYPLIFEGTATRSKIPARQTIGPQNPSGCSFPDRGSIVRNLRPNLFALQIQRGKNRHALTLRICSIPPCGRNGIQKAPEHANFGYFHYDNRGKVFDKMKW